MTESLLKDIELSKINARNLSSKQKNKFLNILFDDLRDSTDYIIDQNRKDVEFSISNNFPSKMIERLTVKQSTINSMLESILEIAKLPDPCGRLLEERSVSHNGLFLKKISCPIGTILVVYESRPNVTLDAAILTIKSGNCVILRGGSEAFYTNMALFELVRKCLKKSGIDDSIIRMPKTTSRDVLLDLLKCRDQIDLLIPRGGEKMIEAIASSTQIPILRHLHGNCHTYIHCDASIDRAIAVLCNAKMRRTSVCGATESLVIDDAILDSLPHIVQELKNAGCEEFVGCEKSCLACKEIKPAVDDDFYTEFLESKISIKVVSDFKEAVSFINKYSSKHTESICTNNEEAIEYFTKNIDSANVFVNISTQFADGYEMGFGSEIGISTGKIHARGPVSLRELTTYKYVVQGDYKLRP